MHTSSLSIAAGRVLLALIFVVSGFNKIVGYGGTAQYMEANGVPGLLLPIVIALELGGGLLIVAGWHTRIVAAALALFTIVAGLLFHADFGDQNQTIHFMKNLAIAGGFLVLAGFGPGSLSVDARQGRAV